MLGGCSSEQDRPGSLVSNSGATIDFRSMPTRTQVGMGPDGSVTYPKGAGAAPVPTTLVFPGGTIRRDFLELNFGANYALSLIHI